MYKPLREALANAQNSDAASSELAAKAYREASIMWSLVAIAQELRRMNERAEGESRGPHEVDPHRG